MKTLESPCPLTTEAQFDVQPPAPRTDFISDDLLLATCLDAEPRIRPLARPLKATRGRAEKRWLWHETFDQLVRLVGPCRAYLTTVEDSWLLCMESFDLVHDWLYDYCHVPSAGLDRRSQHHQADYAPFLVDLPDERTRRFRRAL